jgi:hypothetical protein
MAIKKTGFMLSAFLILQAAASFSAAPPSGMNDAVPNLTPTEIDAIARAITEPALYITRWSQAAVKARIKLARQLRERFPLREAPDMELVRVCMRLTLRLNNRWLECLAGWRIYPGPEDFDVIAAAGLAEIEKYTAGLPPEHHWGPNDDTTAQSILERELKRGINRLPVYRGRGYPPEPNPSPEELEYLAPAAAPR